ncbi:MAG: DNA recombination protein RmuC [Ktedonobacterales bacterium]|nr:DNA recombination protein RmuC [Ktedonobacterales bacterium]
MSEQTLLGILGGVVVVLLLLVAYLLGSRGRGRAPTKPELPPIALPPGMEALRPALEGLHAQLAEMRQGVNELQGKVEQVRTSTEARRGPEDQAWQAIQQVQNNLSALGQLPHVQQSLQEQVASALRDLEAIKGRQTEERQRWEREDTAYSALQRLSAVLLGSATAGAAGERMVADVLGALPPQWLVTDHRVAGKEIEFAVRLPDGLLLPIDSKVVAQSELDSLDHTEDPAQRKSLEQALRSRVMTKAREVTKYIDTRSVGFAVAALPDAAYRLCGPILPQAYAEHRALLVPYSLLAPFVLMVYEQHRHGRVDLESERVAHLLAEAETHLERAAQALNGHVGDAITRLSNGRDTLSRELAEAGRAVTLLREAAQDGVTN